jgi:hypothetical protein
MLYMCTSLLIKRTKETEEKWQYPFIFFFGVLKKKLAGLPKGFKTSEGTIKAIDMSKNVKRNENC